MSEGEPRPKKRECSGFLGTPIPAMVVFVLHAAVVALVLVIVAMLRC